MPEFKSEHLPGICDRVIIVTGGTPAWATKQDKAEKAIKEFQQASPNAKVLKFPKLDLESFESVKGAAFFP
ncbi:hypothetical protein ACJZ2D_012055 [Fusarium nematophilum]